MSELLKIYESYKNKEITTEEFEKHNTKAYYAYLKSVNVSERWKKEFKMIDSTTKYRDVEFLECLKELGIKRFYIIDIHSHLLEKPETLPDYCTVCGIEKIYTDSDFDIDCGIEIPVLQYAIVVEIN
jgi:hypothetical protein